MKHLLLIALPFLAGASLFAGMQHFWIGIRRPYQAMHLLFAALCLVVMCYIIAKIGAYRADSSMELVSYRRVEFLLTMIFFTLFLWFVNVYLEMRARIVPMLFTVIWSGLILVNQILPFSLGFIHAPNIQTIELPWGEYVTDIRVHQRGNWFYFAWAMLLLTFLYNGYLCISNYRKTRQGRALWVLIAVVTFMVFVFTNQLVNFGIVKLPHMAEFGFLAIILLMNASISREIRNNTLLLRQSEAKVRRMAYEDYLTNLPNRAALHEYLVDAVHQARQTSEYGAVLLIDLDHFKTINDSLTHDVGDQVLQGIALRLQRIVRNTVFISRLGGDEFVVVLTGLSVDEEIAVVKAGAFAEKVHESLNESFKVGEHNMSVGASIGIVLFPQQQDSEQDLLRFADIALYQAKARGRHTIQFFLPSMQATAHERMMIERGLRTANFERDFFLHFQPQFDHENNLIGAETLLRWQHPEYGAMDPGRFILIAEEIGQIQRIGNMVLEQACQCLLRWQQLQLPFYGNLAVNVSAWQFTRPDFIRQIKAILLRYPVPPRRLILEITESAMLYDRNEAISKLNILREMGLQISLDDFGTGYSSLAYLKHFHLDELKIDRSFITDIDRKVQHDVQPLRDIALLESMITLGRHMAMRVVAEGVETQRQRNLLLDKGCRYFQGFYFCKPLPEVEFIDWLKANSVNHVGAS